LEHLRAQARAAQHAIDPIRIKAGPGRGFWVKKAAQGIVSYVTAVAKSPDASEKMRFYVMGRRFGTKRDYPDGQNYRPPR